jgi:hypothetical protein
MPEARELSRERTLRSFDLNGRVLDRDGRLFIVLPGQMHPGIRMRPMRHPGLQRVGQLAQDGVIRLEHRTITLMGEGSDVLDLRLEVHLCAHGASHELPQGVAPGFELLARGILDRRHVHPFNVPAEKILALGKSIEFGRASNHAAVIRMGLLIGPKGALHRPLGGLGRQPVLLAQRRI